MGFDCSGRSQRAGRPDLARPRRRRQRRREQVGVLDLHADAGNAMNSYVNSETVRLDGAIRVGSR